MKGEDIIQLVDAIEVGNTDLVHELLHTDVDPVHVVNVTLYNGTGGIDLQNETCPTMTRILGLSFTTDGL